MVTPSRSRLGVTGLPLVAGLVIAGCTAVLVACGGDDGEAGADGNYRVVHIPTSKSEFTWTIRAGAMEEAEKRGIEYEIQIPSAGGDVASQTATVNAVIASKPDAIFVEPIDAKGMVPPLTQAKQAGIKVITYDSQIEATDVPDAFISTDYVDAGRDAGDELVRLTGGQGEVLSLSLFPGLAFSQKLEQGIEESLSEAPGITHLPVGYTEAEPSKAASHVSAALSRNPDLAAVFVGTLYEQQGALTALRSADALGEVKTVAWDANPDTIENLRAGIWDVVVSVPAREYGVRLIDTAQALLEGEDVETEQLLGDCIITEENVDSPDVQPCMYLPVN